ncbi:MAG: 2-oxoacid:acceptor oxidoreductase family protein, partial [Bdellovibrionales bacterium]|nr:2-oxoacid:acceptor oxidoreductase family protein [Bdellovibrionales bacterium]
MSTSTSAAPIRSVAIRFAGDSGDGMQLTGTRFTHETARAGNDLATRPDFPAEIRAPAGTIGGVSAFQVHLGSDEIFTAGDELDVLVAMNPAALRANLADVKQNGTLICNTDAFTERNLQKVGYDSNPLDDEELSTKYNLVLVAVTELTFEALRDVDLPKSSLEKCKNFFALGVICHMYSRSIEDTKRWIEEKFAKSPLLIEANMKALRAGQAFAEASEVIGETFDIPQAQLEKGVYRNITGNQGIAFGLIAAGELSGTSVFYSGYPITPASDILHEVSRYKNFSAITLQAEDEIAACCAAIGASYVGALGVTASSGPGILLKQEAIGLAASAELPLVIINVQRAGPSTGMPTKTEQADLLNAFFGRNGECPIAILAISQPDDAFETTVEACRIALEHMTPVMILSDGYIGNGSQPWQVVRQEDLPPIRPHYAKLTPGQTYYPFERDEKTLARGWALPGTPGLEHRLGGLEK